MINRSLIRIKTIQILYSYLLTRSDFHMESAPEGSKATADSVFAYSVYLDYIFLLLKLSRIPVATGTKMLGPDSVLERNAVARELCREKEMAELLKAPGANGARFDAILPELAQRVAQSQPYNEVKNKRKFTLAGDAEFWKTVFEKVIAGDAAVSRTLRATEGFTTAGAEKGLAMLLNTLTELVDARMLRGTAKADLDKSLQQAYDLYHALLYMPVLITDLAGSELELEQRKYSPSADTIAKCRRLLDNGFTARLAADTAIADYFAANPGADPTTWKKGNAMLEQLYNQIKQSEIFAAYVESAPGDYNADVTFWRDAMRSIVLPSDALAESLETTSVYWNDDLHITGTFVLKTIKRAQRGESSRNDEQLTLLPKFMNHDDEVFGSQLFDYVADNRLTYRSYIDRFINSAAWDSERLAFMDIVITMAAVAELINFPSIPIAVTCNEYVEIANEYSTPRSGKFINGLLVSIIKMLDSEGRLNKK